MAPRSATKELATRPISFSTGCSIEGLTSDLERKNVESIAYRYDEERMNPQRFMGWSAWDHAPLMRELARQVGKEVEDCIERAKSEAGLADYEVRNWTGWHHHQVLSLVATWFLTREKQRGKKWTPALSVPQIRTGLAWLLREACGRFHPCWHGNGMNRKSKRKELARFYHYKRKKLMPPSRVKQRL